MRRRNGADHPGRHVDPRGGDRARAVGGAPRTGRGAGPRLRAHGPAAGRPDPRPVRRRRRGRHPVDRRHRLALPPHVRVDRAGRDPPRPRRRGPRHPRHDRAQRHRRRDHRQPAPLVPVPRRAPAPTGHERARRHVRRARPRSRAAVRTARRRAAPRQPPPLQRAPQERVELRVGLGRRRRHERHLEVDRHRVLERRPHRGRPPARRPRRHHRGADGPRRRRARRLHRLLLAGDRQRARRVRGRFRGQRPGGPDHPGPAPRVRRAPGFRHRRPGRRRAPRRRRRGDRPPRGPRRRRLVAPRRGRPAAVRRPGRGRRRRVDRPRRIPHRHARHRCRRRRRAVPAPRQRPSGHGARGELDPRPRLPDRDDARAVRGPDRMRSTRT